MALSEAMRKKINQTVEKKTGVSASPSSGGSSTPATSANSSYNLSSTMLDRIQKNVALKRLGREDTGVDEEYIKKFQNDYQRFLYDSQYDYDRMTWQSSRDGAKSGKRSSTEQDLAARETAIRTYLDINRDYFDEETYKSITAYLDEFDTNRAGIMHNFDVKKSYFSQWETEEDYNDYVAEVEAYEAMVNFDLSAGEKEIDELKQRRAEIFRTKRPTGSSYLTGDSTLDSSPYGAGLQDSGFDQELADLDKLISQKKQYLNQARHIQEGVKLSGVADPESEYYDSDFVSNSKYSSTKKANPAWWENETGDTQYEWINNQNGFRDEYESSMADLNAKAGASSQSDFYIGPSESVYYQKNYDRMNSTEVAIYNYYYATEGKEKAQEYLDSIQENLNMRKATAMFADMDDKTFQEMIFGVEAGLDQFRSGITNLFNTEDDYIPQSDIQMASGMVREDLADRGAKLPKWLGGASLGQAGYDMITTSANMAPSIMTSMVVGMLNPTAGAVAGSALMGASAAGNAYQEMLNLGYDKKQARMYSTLVGSTEAGLQYLLGGIGKLGGKLSGQALTSMMNGVDNAILRTALKLVGNMASEGIEEGLTEIMTTWMQNLVLYADEDVNWNEVAYSTLLGALTAGVMEGPSTISEGVSTYRTGTRLQEAGITAQNLADVGNKFAADTVAAQLAGRVNENTGAYTLGRLFNEICATMTEQNLNDITNALVKEGMSDNVARANARALAAVVEGGNLTDRQVKIIESNDVLAKAAISTIIDPNSTVLQRNKGYNEMLIALAKEKVASDASKESPVAPGQNNQKASNNVDGENKNGTENLSGADGVDTSPAKVSAISSIKDGKVTIKLEDGTEVDIKEADLDPDEGVRIETIAGIEGISASDASYILGTLKAVPGASAQIDSLGAVEAYKYGFYGFSQDHIAKHGVFANSLSKAQRDTIYETGRNARQQQVDNKNATVAKKNATTEKSSTTGIYFDAGSGKVTAFNDAKKALTEKQTAGVRAAQVLRKLGIGGNIYFFESYRNSKNQLVYKDKNGKEVKAPNGWYSEKDGSIHIDLNAGKGGNGFVLFTLAHELTHFIEQWSPQKYKILADFLIENYEKGQSMDKLVRAKQEKLSNLRGEAVSYNEAYSEVIADSMEAMLADGNVLDKLIELKAKDNGLFMKMKQFFDNLVAKIRRIYEGQTPDSVEGQTVLEMKDSIEKIQQLFAEALVEASDNFRSAVENVVEAKSEPVAAEEIITDGAVVTDGEGTKYSIRSMKHDIAEGQMFEDLKKYCGWSQRRVNELKKNLTDLVEYMTPYRDILDMNETYDREGRRFSPYKPNSDPLYTISMDFSTLCS